MTLSPVDRGVLESYIDNMKNGLAAGYYEIYKPRSATKDNIVWYCKGDIYGSFEMYFLMTYKRAFKNSEIPEVVDVIERRTNEIADVLAEYDED